jgi:ABC-type spermidine/putrescine transport system permease subunit II
MGAGGTVGVHRAIGETFDESWIGETRDKVLNTAILTLLGALVVVAISFAVACVTVRTELRGRSMLDYLAFLPFGFPSTVMAVDIIAALTKTPLHDPIWILLLGFAVKSCGPASATSPTPCCRSTGRWRRHRSSPALGYSPPSAACCCRYARQFFWPH